MISITCKCGCGKEVSGRTYKSHGKIYIHEYRPGHFPKNKGKMFSEEWKRKLGESHKGHRVWSEGKTLSDEIKEKIRASCTGKKHSAETRLKISLALTGKSKPPHPHTQETKDSIAKTHLGMKASEKTKRLLSEMRRGKKLGSQNPNWRGGRVSERDRIRHSAEHKEWLRSVLQRFNYLCIRCTAHADNAHHIRNFADYPELRLDPENGASLCRECHEIFHWVYGKKLNNERQFSKFLLR